MSRKIDPAVQTEDSRSAWVNHSIEDFTCPVTKSLFFDPVIACNTAATCGHSFEKRECVGKLKQCPCCREEITLVSPALHTKNTLDEILLGHPKLWQDVYFNLDHFTEVFTQENGLKTQNGIRFIRLLEHASNHLNDKAIEGTQRGKSAIEILASTLAGRDLLRKKLRIDVSGKFFFGHHKEDAAEISPTSLQIQINGKSIQEWLSISTAMEIMQDEEQKARQALFDEAQTITRNLHSDFQRILRSQGLFRTGAAAAGHRVFSETVNPTLQKVVYGNEAAVKAALESVRSDLAQLAALLSDTGTVKDYSDRTITGMTLLQAAAASGDIDMCLMLKNYMSPEEFATQLAEIFPKGIEAHEREQQRNTFNFDAILAAIRAANTLDLDAALNKTDNGSVLCRALEEFRHQFSELSNNEKIFNPQHLLRAFEVYNALWNRCEGDSSDRDYKKRDLFWRQIIGYTQRFMPACYAQAFSQGLYYLVKVDQLDSWRPEAFKRDLKLRRDNFSYFPLPIDSRSGLGFDFAIYALMQASTARRCVPALCRPLFPKTFVEQKQLAFRTLRREGRVQSREQSDERRCVVKSMR
ncbi:MAG: hypothetical protein A3F13_09810 [Gammaproteobacteria bacterium RIFCSPHIGHO2_12_FULL_40_19]|nr:MAG: hypothetical protein A3F13_09810 [Gammaproteobacteria bacterium RIFCSPHIGHO2_12_FULL_40_19]